VIAEDMSMDKARGRFDGQYRETRGSIDRTTAADAYPRFWGFEGD
jgi:hypothetical protein